VRAVKFRWQRGTKTCVLKRIRFIAKRCSQFADNVYADCDDLTIKIFHRR